MGLRDVHVDFRHQTLLEPAFHNTPQRLDRVEFRRVGGLERQLDVVTRTVFSHDVCMVRSVIVKDQLDRRCGLTSGQRLTNHSDEGVEVGRVCRWSQQEERLRKMLAHRSDDCDSCVSCLVQHEFDGLLLRAPRPLAVHPAVEAGFVDVHQEFLLLNECGERDGKLPPLLLFLQNHALLVRIGTNQVLDAVPVVERAQPRE